MLKFIILAICILKSLYVQASTETNTSRTSMPVDNQYSVQCRDRIEEKNNLTVDWYLSEPYQFSRLGKNGRYIVTGLDTELINILSTKVGVSIKYIDSVWQQAIRNIESGESDLVAGATNTKDRASFATFSLPYRFEEISLFTLETGKKKLMFNNINEFLAQIRLLNFRLGIIKEFVYGNMEITEYLNRQGNNDIIIKYTTDAELLHALTRKEIDGFLADRIVGLALVLNDSHREQIQETQLGIKTPIHLMFSKKTVSVDVVERFNSAIQGFIRTDAYKKIFQDYIYKVLLPQAVSSEWCYIIGLVGSIAFAISGIFVAVRENATFFGTFILALLPSVLGCIFLDLIINETEDISLTLTPSYAYYVFITVIIGFSIMKLSYYYNKQLYEDDATKKILSNTLVICDALGQASFVIIGVVMVIVRGIEPLEFWGPCFACLTSGVGVVLRELICNHNASLQFIHGKVNFEISILWGLIFSILLDINYYNLNDSTIKYSIITVIAGAFITRLLVHYYNIGNLTFREDKEKLPE